MNEEYEIGKQIQMLSRKIKRKMDEAFFSYGITGTQAFMLKFIHEKQLNGKVYAKTIENEFDMRKPTITGILQLMEQNKFIKRKAEGEDARLKEIVITKKGMEIVKTVDLKVQELEKNIAKGISQKEIKEFLKIAEKISTNLSCPMEDVSK